ncbi:hypothetical protein B6U91_02475 [Candidatus Pacearchaeota archaeon ex4484_71]|nr:MAG: hypothetical protein B6U91_02475 [Candidatus Pacearchaeota archaeon ex4484_71]
MRNKYSSIFWRYLILVLIALPGFSIFYLVFLPLTIHPVSWVLGLFYPVSILKNIVFVNSFPIEIIGACIAGSAYYLLLILNLTIPDIPVLKRIKMIFLSFAAFFVINFIRIITLSIMYVEESQAFELTHKLFWYLGSTLFVLAIWFLEVRLFRIRGVPIKDDLKYIYRRSSFRKTNRKN